MFNIMLTGVGGQGTVLAAKVLAQAARDKGWHVRTAETIGMAQRGGSVVSHVRMGNGGEQAASPLITKGMADLVIAFEPAEAARVLPYLAPVGSVVTATTAVQPVTSALSQDAYRAGDVVERLSAMLGDRLIAVDDEAVLSHVGARKALNTVLLAYAVASGRLPLDVDALKRAIVACVKPAFVDMNMRAVDVVVEGRW